MSKTLRALRISAAGLFFALPAFAQETPTADTVVATVNNAEITLGHMIAVRETLPAQYQQLAPEVLFSGILDQIIQQTLLAQAVGDDIPKRTAKTLEVQRTAILADAAVDAALAERVDDAALRAMYDAKYGDFTGAQEFDASHILVETEEEAQAIATEILRRSDHLLRLQEPELGEFQDRRVPFRADDIHGDDPDRLCGGVCLHADLLPGCQLKMVTFADRDHR